jgi:hypothetical protein
MSTARCLRNLSIDTTKSPRKGSPVSANSNQANRALSSSTTATMAGKCRLEEQITGKLLKSDKEQNTAPG